MRLLLAAAVLGLAGCGASPPAPAPPAPPAPRASHPVMHSQGQVPLKALTYAPLLAQKQRAIWPTAPDGWTLGGLVEQESCNSLRSLHCWDPHAELKTHREYGFGLGQITITSRFNEFNELKSKYVPLAQWRWEDRYNPSYQLIAIVEMTYNLWRRVPPARTNNDHWAFALVSYNGGLGALLKDRRYCGNSSGCDTEQWFDNIETHSLKSRAPQRAYGGQSWYSITRGYVRNVLNVRRAKYEQFWRT